MSSPDPTAPELGKSSEGQLPASPLFDDETPFATMMASFDHAAKELGPRQDRVPRPAQVRPRDRDLHPAREG